MASERRKQRRSAKKIATMGAATATVTAMTMTLTQLPQANADAPVNTPVATAISQALVGGFATSLLGGLSGGALSFAPLALAGPTAAAATPGSAGLPPMELAPGAPDPSAIPDLTFGLGTSAYDGFQTVGAAIERFLLDNFNLSGLLAQLGLDPEDAINNALGAALTGLLAGIPLDLSGLGPVGAILAPILTAAGITDVLDLTNLIGLDLSDPLDLAGVAAPGLNIITTGPPFSLLKFLGVDLGWVPGYPNSVADEINDTPYLNVGAAGILTTLITNINANPALTFLEKLALTGPLQIVLAEVGDADLVDLRIPVVAGFGLGAFAAGMAYPQVVAQLPYQPGGALYEGTSPIAGSVTVLPLILLRNPGRANGGLFARFYPLAALAGIDTVTPDTEVSNSIDPSSTPLLEIAGLALGGANLVPIKIDGTVQYDPLSDFPSWFNPVSLLNAGAAALFPTYILRGLTLAGVLDALGDQAGPQIAEALAGVTAGDPLALNLYLTLPTDALPLLEPIRLPVDFLNLVTGANFNNPLATALEPALKILTNLGFTDVDQDNGYERTLDQADVITPFGTLPSNIDWGRVPGDVFAALVTGIEQAVAEGIISPTPVDNPLRTIVNIIEQLLGGGTSSSTLSAVTADDQLPEVVAAGLRQQSEATEEPSAQSAAAPVTSDGPAAKDDVQDAPQKATTHARNQLDGSVARTSKRTQEAAEDALGQVSASVEGATKALNDIADAGREQINKLTGGTTDTKSEDKQADTTGKNGDTDSAKKSDSAKAAA